MRLIDADALLNDLKASAKDAREWGEEVQDEEIKIRAEQAYCTFVECALRVKNEPTIEAEPVRRGNWLESTIGKAYCPYCNYEPQYDDDKYCANCGARMGGGADNG